MSLSASSCAERQFDCERLRDPRAGTPATRSACPDVNWAFTAASPSPLCHYIITQSEKELSPTRVPPGRSAHGPTRREAARQSADPGPWTGRDLLTRWIGSRTNMNTATNHDSPWLSRGRAADAPRLPRRTGQRPRHSSRQPGLSDPPARPGPRPWPTPSVSPIRPPVSLGEAITGIDDRNVGLLVEAVLGACGRRQFQR